MNTLPCKDCQNYDVVLGPGGKPTRHGWCKKKSVYPTKEGPGQLFPLGVKRASAGQLAKPFIIKGEGVEVNCQDVTLKKKGGGGGK